MLDQADDDDDEDDGQPARTTWTLKALGDAARSSTMNPIKAL